MITIKKIGITILLIFLLTNICNAQFVQSYGIKIGLTFAKHDFEGFNFPEKTIQRRIGFTGGFFFEWLNLSMISIISQVEYSQRGISSEITKTDAQGNPAGTLTTNSQLDYLSFPFLGKISMSSMAISPYLLAGIRYDYLLGHSEFLEDIYNKFRKSVFGGTIGIGIKPKLPITIHPLIELRYNFDFTDSYIPESFGAKNNAFDLTLGIAF